MIIFECKQCESHIAFGDGYTDWDVMNHPVCGQVSLFASGFAPYPSKSSSMIPRCGCKIHQGIIFVMDQVHPHPEAWVEMPSSHTMGSEVLPGIYVDELGLDNSHHKSCNAGAP